MLKAVTIGLPVFNGERTLSRAIECLLAQTFGDFELVISDNGSSDRTEDICRGYVERDPRVRYIRHPAALDAAMSFRFVLFEAGTSYFMWAGAEDQWAPSFLERNLEFLEAHPDYVASQSRVLFTLDGRPSHYSAGTGALKGEVARNLSKFFDKPADNCRFYGLYRTTALKEVFPSRDFAAFDWAVPALTLNSGFHNELSDTLMLRTCGDAGVYQHVVYRRQGVFRILPVLSMAWYFLRADRVAFSFGLLRRLIELNLFVYSRPGLARWNRLGRQFVRRGGDGHGAKTGIVTGLGSRTASGLRARLKRAVGFSFPLWVYSQAYFIWRRVPIGPRLREVLQRRFRSVMRPIKRAAGDYEGISTAHVTDDAAPGSPPGFRLPNRNWRVPAPSGSTRVCASVIVVVTDDVCSTLALIDSIGAAQQGIALEVIVVDNGSSDITSLLFRGGSDVVYIRSDVCEPFGVMANIGLSQARAGTAIFLDRQTLVGKEGLLKLLEGVDKTDAMVGPKIMGPDGRLKAAGGAVSTVGDIYGIGRSEQPQAPKYNYVRPVDYCPAAFAVRRRALEDAGGFDETYETFDVSSVDLARRIRLKGKQAIYWPTASVVSYGDGGAAEAAEHARAPAWRHDLERFRDRDEKYPGSDRPTQDKAADGIGCDQSGHVLYVAGTTPRPDQDSGSVGTVNLLKILRSLGFRVTFVPESDFAYAGAYTATLQELGIEVLYRPFFSSMRSVLKEVGDNLEVVFLYRVDPAHTHIDVIREMVPSAKIVFNTADLQWVRFQREVEFSDVSNMVELADANRTKELGVIGKADYTMVLSTYEREILERELPKAPVRVIPLIRDIPDAIEVPEFAERRDIMFVGTFRHSPNVDAVKYFVGEIWPLVRERLPDAKFLIVGSGMHPDVARLQGNGVQVLGYVEDLASLFHRCRVSVAPLRYGAGLKGKVSSSLEFGLPVVATPIAIEGAAFVDEQNVLVAQEPEDFASSIVRLYTDEALWQRLSENGFDFVRREFSIPANTKRVRRLISDLQR